MDGGFGREISKIFSSVVVAEKAGTEEPGRDGEARIYGGVL